MTQRQSYLLILLVCFILKLALAGVAVLLADEAYFVLWGKYPALGYYDHPPLIGWLLTAVSQIGTSPIFIRLPAILASLFASVSIYICLCSLHPQGDSRKAFWVSLLFMWSPVSLVNIFITTDTPLLFFSTLSGCLMAWAYYRGNHWAYYGASLCLGCAFLSKYFAILLGIAYIVALLAGREKHHKHGLLILCLTILPFALFHLWWNYENGWPNIMFNIVNRVIINRSGSIWNIFLLMGMLIYLMMPPALWYLIRQRREIIWQQLKNSPARFFAFIYFIPLLMFAIASFRKSIGLHWLISFMPFFCMLLYYLLSRRQLKVCALFALFLSVCHVIGLLFFALMPSETFRIFAKNPKNYAKLVTWKNNDEFGEIVSKQTSQDVILATRSYARSALLEYWSGRRVLVWGKGSYHARQDDILTNFKDLDGKDFRIISWESKEDEKESNHEFKPYFRQIEITQLDFKGQEITVIDGKGFEYEVYRKDCLQHINEVYYAIPDFLPGPRIFMQKYDLIKHK